MRKSLSALLAVALLTLSLGVGCAHNPQSTLPAGATSPSDASTYRVLNDAHAFLQSVRDSVVTGKIGLTPAQKTAFNALVASSNSADALWQTCHVGGCTTAQQQQLTTQTNQLNASLAAAQQQIVVAK